MKKIFILSLSLAAALCACTKQELIPSDNQSAQKQIITAYVNSETKAVYTDTGKGATSVWKEGDTFLAIQDGSKVVTFTLTSGAGTNTGVFTAETTGATATTTWKGVLGGAAVADGNKINCVYTNQTGKLEDLDKYVYASASASGLEPRFEFNNGKAFTYVFRMKMPAGMKTIDYCTSAGWTIMADGEAIAYDKGEEGSYSELKNTIFSLDAATKEGDIVYLAVPAINYTLKRDNYANGQQWANTVTNLVITFLNDTSDNATLSGGTFVTADLTSLAGKIGDMDLSKYALVQRPKVSEAIRVQRTNISVSWAKGEVLEPASSLDTYWAPYNIGATKETEIGIYYSFGECFSRTDYQFTNYSLRRSTPGNESSHHHYAIASHVKVGTTVNYYSIAGSKYDVARVKWGSAWRMPYIVECHALYNGTYSTGATEYVEKTTVGGVDGVKFSKVSGGNGYLFFPNSGHYERTALTDASQACWRSADQQNNLYASSSNNTTNYDKCYVFRSPYDVQAGSDICDGGNKDRAAWAVPVRAVLAKSVWNY